MLYYKTIYAILLSHDNAQLYFNTSATATTTDVLRQVSVEHDPPLIRFTATWVIHVNTDRNRTVILISVNKEWCC